MRSALVLFVGFISLLSAAQNEPPVARAGAQGGTLTRSASKYQALELRLLEAQQENDRATVSSLLTQDFEAWIAGAGSPAPRAEWAARWQKNHPGSYQLRDFSTREFGDVAVVSFVLYPANAAKSKCFVVDVWQQTTGLLAVRYEAEAKVRPQRGHPPHKG